MHLIPLIIDPPPGHASLLVFSFVLAVLLIVSLVLSGVGFYGVYRRGGGGAGVLALIAAITGGTLGATLTTLGNILQQTEYVIVVNYFLFPFPVLYPVREPNYLFVWVGMLVVAVTFILLGSASIAVRASTATPSVALAAGILSIIGACLLPLYGLSMVGHETIHPPLFLSFPLVNVAGGIFALFAFTLILVAFVLWTVVFYSSREAIF